MNISKPTNFVRAAILFFIFSNAMFSQKLEPKERITEPDHIISSKIMGKDYQLYMSFPKSYSTKDTISYPVLYVLDGAPAFPIITGTHKTMSLGNEIEEVIIVGIGSGLNLPSWLINRTYDYTTSVDNASTSNIEKQYGFPEGTLKSGGADKLLESIKTEIIPLVDKNYKTNTDRGIMGHSLGGLFTAYCLIHSDGYFTRFGISSPSFWWDNEQLLNKASTELTTNKTWEIPPTKVFICVGKNEGPSMVPPMEKFNSLLKTADYKNIDSNWQIFDGESHLSVMPASISKSISTLYGKK